MHSLKSIHYRRSYSTYIPCALRQCCIRDTVSRDFPYILLNHSVAMVAKKPYLMKTLYTYLCGWKYWQELYLAKYCFKQILANLMLVE